MTSFSQNRSAANLEPVSQKSSARDDLSHFLPSLISARAVFVFNETYWNQQEGRFRGGFLWNSIPQSSENLKLFAKLGMEILGSALRDADVVIALSSSGISWGTSLALEAQKDLFVLKLKPHSYGPWNPGLERFRGKRGIIVDNYFGSGDTVKQAIEVLAPYQVQISDAIVPERFYSKEFDMPCRVNHLFLTTDKLNALLKIGYFQGVEAEIMSRIAEDPAGHMLDKEWVEKMRVKVPQH